MTGGFRFFLAVLVAASHLVGSDYGAHLGDFAVRGFFVLSGMSITASLNEVYGFRLLPFWVNRILRLVPNYLMACLATALIIHASPEDAGAFLSRWRFDANWGDVFDNLVIFPLAFAKPDFRFIEPAWSIAVELFMYGLLCLGMARNQRCALFGLSVGVTYHLVAWLVGRPFEFRYFGLEAALFSFSLGAWTYFLLKRGDLTPSRRLLAGAGAVWLANLVLAGSPLLPVPYNEGVGYYLNTITAAPLVACLSALQPSPGLRRLDKLLADLAYPVFLTQWVGGFLAHHLFMRDAWRGFDLLSGAAPLILLLSVLFMAFQNRLVEPLRHQIRGFVPTWLGQAQRRPA